MDDERVSELTPLGSLMPSTSRKQTGSGKNANDVWPRKPKGPWVTFVRREIPPGAKTLQQIMGKRKSYLIPAFVNDNWREFYRWVKGYGGMSVDEVFPHECKVCRGAGHVLTKRRELVACPRWDAQAKRCWR